MRATAAIASLACFDCLLLGEGAVSRSKRAPGARRSPSPLDAPLYRRCRIVNESISLSLSSFHFPSKARVLEETAKQILCNVWYRMVSPRAKWPSNQLGSLGSSVALKIEGLSVRETESPITRLFSCGLLAQIYLLCGFLANYFQHGTD